MLKSWILILSLILAALPAFAGSEQPFNPGDVVVTGVTAYCGPHTFGGFFGAALYRRGSVLPVSFSNVDLGFPVPTGVVTYSPALNRMILGTSAGLEMLDVDGGVTPLLALSETRVTALAGVGSEILAVVVRSTPLYRFELWRIAGADGTVTEQIGLPFSPPPLTIRDIISIDLAGDRCTLAYAVPDEPVHRYDICRRQPLADVGARRAWAVHFLPGGDLLVAENIHSGAWPFSQWLTRYDREGRILITADPALHDGEWIRAIALDPDGLTAWILTASDCRVSSTGWGRLISVNTSNGALIASPLGGGNVGVAVVGEWRAAAQPPARRHAIR